MLSFAKTPKKSNRQRQSRRKESKMAKAKRKFWAGFVNDKIYETDCWHGDIAHAKIPIIYCRRKDAKKSFCDVRPIEIREIK